MTRLQKMKTEEYSSFLRVCFGLTTPSPVGDLTKEPEWIDTGLNDSQKSAIRFALGSREMALIHGPPGVSSSFSFSSSSFSSSSVFSLWRCFIKDSLKVSNNQVKNEESSDSNVDYNILL
jgi:hypothetical protein